MTAAMQKDLILGGVWLAVALVFSWLNIKVSGFVVKLFTFLMVWVSAVVGLYFLIEASTA